MTIKNAVIVMILIQKNILIVEPISFKNITCIQNTQLNYRNNSVNVEVFSSCKHRINYLLILHQNMRDMKKLHVTFHTNLLITE